MSDNTENKGKLEQFHLRGRNYDAVVRQLVEKYNASEGWAVVRVVPSILSLDVYLERNAEQGNSKAAAKPTATKPAEPKVETKDKAKVDVEVVDEKEKQTVAKKAATTNKTATKK